MELHFFRKWCIKYVVFYWVIFLQAGSEGVPALNFWENGGVGDGGVAGFVRPVVASEHSLALFDIADVTFDNVPFFAQLFNEIMVN